MPTQAPRLVEVYSSSGGCWFVAAVVTEDDDQVVLRFTGADGLMREKIMHPSDTALASFGCHTDDPPPGFNVVPSSTRPGQVAYLDVSAMQKYISRELAWQAYLKDQLAQHAHMKAMHASQTASAGLAEAEQRRQESQEPLTDPPRSQEAGGLSCGACGVIPMSASLGPVRPRDGPTSIPGGESALRLSPVQEDLGEAAAWPAASIPVSALPASAPPRPVAVAPAVTIPPSGRSLLPQVECRFDAATLNMRLDELEEQTLPPGCRYASPPADVPQKAPARPAIVPAQQASCGGSVMPPGWVRQADPSQPFPAGAGLGRPT
mmetsp:Transcript_66027/g.123137  ORF Transcript_66027/g.123137 Transcript_66027/m.123137 type:complete len:320 (-) Transcript_66027:59-1018(-)